MNWNRFIMLIVSIISLAGITKMVMACAGGDDYYTDNSFFLNTVNKQPAFIPFYYTPYLVFYTDGYGYSEFGYDDKVPNPNLSLWRAYTGKEVSKADIDSFVYKFSGNDVTAIYQHVRKKDPLLVEDKVSSNGFTKWLISHRDAAALQYISFAKKCEPYTAPQEATWDRDAEGWVAPKRDSAAMQELVQEGIRYYDATKKSELKLRYAYQVIRMAFYSRQFEQTISLFNTMVTDRTDNFLYYRCLALKAGGLYRTGQKVDAAYLYSLVFDKTDDNKKAVYNSFRWAVNGDIRPVIELCKSNHEKAVVYVMQGLYDYAESDKNMISSLRNAYNMDPGVKGLEVVMTRYINKIENTVIPEIATAVNRHDATLRGLNSFAQRVAAEGKNGSPAYWYLASAYLYILDGDAPNCKVYLDKAAGEKMAPYEEDVQQVINVLYVMKKDGKVTPATEAELLPLLKSVQSRFKDDKKASMLFSNLMVAVLKAAYMKEGNAAKAIYCYSKINSGANPDYQEDFQDEPGRIMESMTFEGMHAVEAFVLKKNKTPFDAWLTENTKYSAGVLYELEGTKYLRMHQFDKAIEYLSKVPDNLLKKTQLPDILVSHILDGQEWNKSDKAVSYDKLRFARKMLELQEILKKDPKDGRVAYQYANGLYSMSYYGKGHRAYDYYRNTTDDAAYHTGDDRSKLADYEQEHYSVQKPERYYVQAFENSSDPEVKARCLFMAAKCWQKNCSVPVKRIFDRPYADDYYMNTFNNPYLAKLKKDYSSAKFFADATGTCSYFRDYVAVRRK